MEDHSNHQIDTQLVHAGAWDEDPTGASSVPIFRGSTYDQSNPEGSQRWDYGRSGNPTRAALEQSIAILENGSVGLAFASGIAAISSTFMLFKPGDHLVVGEDIYGGTYRALTTIFQRWGLVTTWVDAADIHAIQSALRPETRAVFVETPSNPLMRICDLKAIAELCKSSGVLAITDNTFMTPLLQRPLDLGFDISLHSGTKFLGGHSDVVAGLAVVKDLSLGKQLKQIQNGFGAILGPDDSWMLLRGIRSLGPRMREQQSNAAQMAEWLSQHHSIKNVYYPGLTSHLGHSIHRSQSTGDGAVLSFELADRTSALAFMKKLQIPLTAVSLGGIESIVSYPATMSHAAMPPQERLRRGISDGLLRLSVGLEDVNDLKKDFDSALR